MSTSDDMEPGLFELLARFIRERDGDTPFRLAEQEAELQRRNCGDPEMGKWMAANDFPFLVETLMLSDAVFSEEYPGVELAASERRRFAAALEGHCEVCARCGLARAYDLEWQSRVSRAFAENKEAVGQAISRAAGEK